ncbi:MAG: urease accessory protein UreF [Pseudomonadota bacterium]
MNATSLLHLLQFASPALPIGGYSYSQGLEAALEENTVHDADTARSWIAGYLHEVVARWDAALFWRLLKAFEADNQTAVAHWSECYLASRDTAESRAETVQMGYSLARLLVELGLADADSLAGDVGLPHAFARAVHALGIGHEEALLAMLFACAENQVLVCVKSVPLGQVAGQRVLLSLRTDIEQAALVARTLHDDDMSNWAPGLSILSMLHEVQQGRLYRS